MEIIGKYRTLDECEHVCPYCHTIFTVDKEKDKDSFIYDRWVDYFGAQCEVYIKCPNCGRQVHIDSYGR